MAEDTNTPELGRGPEGDPKNETNEARKTLEQSLEIGRSSWKESIDPTTTDSEEQWLFTSFETAVDQAKISKDGSIRNTFERRTPDDQPMLGESGNVRKRVLYEGIPSEGVLAHLEKQLAAEKANATPDPEKIQKLEGAQNFIAQHSEQFFQRHKDMPVAVRLDRTRQEAKAIARDPNRNPGTPAQNWERAEAILIERQEVVFPKNQQPVEIEETAAVQMLTRPENGYQKDSDKSYSGAVGKRLAREASEKTTTTESVISDVPVESSPTASEKKGLTRHKEGYSRNPLERLRRRIAGEVASVSKTGEETSDKAPEVEKPVIATPPEKTEPPVTTPEVEPKPLNEIPPIVMKPTEEDLKDLHITTIIANTTDTAGSLAHMGGRAETDEILRGGKFWHLHKWPRKIGIRFIETGYVTRMREKLFKAQVENNSYFSSTSTAKNSAAEVDRQWQDSRKAEREIVKQFRQTENATDAERAALEKTRGKKELLDDDNAFRRDLIDQIIRPITDGTTIVMGKDLQNDTRAKLQELVRKHKDLPQIREMFGPDGKNFFGDEASFFATDILETALTVKHRMELHKMSLADMDKYLHIAIGRSRPDVQGEQRGVIDKWVAKAREKHSVLEMAGAKGAGHLLAPGLANPLLVGIGASLVMQGGLRGISMAGRVAALPTLFVGTFAGAATSAIRKRGEISRDRTTQQTERVYSQASVPEEDKNRKKLEAVDYRITTTAHNLLEGDGTTKSVTELLAPPADPTKTEQRTAAIIQRLAEIRGRQELGLDKAKDLVNYTSPQLAAKERFELMNATINLRIGVTEGLSDAEKIDMQDRIDKAVSQWKAHNKGDLREQDEAFFKLRRSEVTKAALWGGATGALGGLLSQESRAIFDRLHGHTVNATILEKPIGLFSDRFKPHEAADLLNKGGTIHIDDHLQAVISGDHLTLTDPIQHTEIASTVFTKLPNGHIEVPQGLPGPLSDELRAHGLSIEPHDGGTFIDALQQNKPFDIPNSHYEVVPNTDAHSFVVVDKQTGMSIQGFHANPDGTYTPDGSISPQLGEQLKTSGFGMQETPSVTQPGFSFTESIQQNKPFDIPNSHYQVVPHLDTQEVSIIDKDTNLPLQAFHIDTNGTYSPTGDLSPHVKDSLTSLGFDVQEHSPMSIETNIFVPGPLVEDHATGFTTHIPDNTQWVPSVEDKTTFDLVDKSDPSRIFFKGAHPDQTTGKLNYAPDQLHFGTKVDVNNIPIDNGYRVVDIDQSQKISELETKDLPIVFRNNNTPNKFDFDELRGNTWKVGDSEMVFREDHMLPDGSWNDMYTPRSVDIPAELRANHGAVWFQFEDGRRILIHQNDPFGVRLNINDNVPSHVLDVYDDVTGEFDKHVQMGEFSRMVINKDEFDKLPTGYVETELNNKQATYNVAVIAYGAMNNVNGRQVFDDVAAIHGVPGNPVPLHPTNWGYTIQPQGITGQQPVPGSITITPPPAAPPTTIPGSTILTPPSTHLLATEIGFPEGIDEPVTVTPFDPRKPLEPLQNNLPVIPPVPPQKPGGREGTGYPYAYGEFSVNSEEFYNTHGSDRLRKEPNAQLDAAIEISEYFVRQNPEYRQQLEAYMSQEGLRAPMDNNTDAIVCIPVFDLGEGRTVKHALEAYLMQIDKAHNTQAIDPSKFELLLFLNHAENARKDLQSKKGESYMDGAAERVKDGDPAVYDTEEVIKQFMAAHPELNIRVMKQEFPGDRPKWGNIIKPLYDVALMRSMKRTGAEKKDPLILTNDIDVIKLSPTYMRDILQEADMNDILSTRGMERHVDAWVGKIDMPNEGYKDHPGFLVAERLYQFLDAQNRRDSYKEPGKMDGAPITQGRSTILRSSIYAAIGGVNTSIDAGADTEMGKRIVNARKFKRAIRADKSSPIEREPIEYLNKAWLESEAKRELGEWQKGVPLAYAWDSWGDLKMYSNEERGKLFGNTSQNSQKITKEDLEKEIYFESERFGYGPDSKQMERALSWLGLKGPRRDKDTNTVDYTAADYEIGKRKFSHPRKGEVEVDTIIIKNLDGVQSKLNLFMEGQGVKDPKVKGWEKGERKFNKATGDENSSILGTTGLSAEYLDYQEFNRIYADIFKSKEYPWQPEPGNDSPTIIDLGSHIGLSTLYWKSIRPNAKVTAVEANPETTKVLERNIARNHLTDVTVVQAAASPNDGTVNLYQPKPGVDYHWGDFVSGTPADTDKYDAITVPGVKLSTLINGPIDLLKVDIEGSELGVLKEAESKLLQVKEIMLEFHVNPENSTNSLVETIDLLQRNGYAFEVRREEKVIDTDSLNPTLTENLIIHAKRSGTPGPVAPSPMSTVESVAPLTTESTPATETGNVAETLPKLEAFASKDTLESKETYEASLDKALEVLRGTEGIVELRKGIPTIVIPDLHAQREYLLKILQKEVEGAKVYDLIKQGKINIVCVGDGMHSENLYRWALQDSRKYPLHIKSNRDLLKYDPALYSSINTAYEGVENTRAHATDRYRAANPSALDSEILTMVEADVDVRAAETTLGLAVRDGKNKQIQDEMTRSLGLMKMVMDLKATYPGSFHYLRGNHDDIDEHIGAFYKYANESKDVKDWVTKTFGKDFLDKWAEFEESLPLLAKGDDFAVSHAALPAVYTADQIKNRDKTVQQAITWTDNQGSGITPIETALSQNLKNIGLPESSRWVIGHRKTDLGLQAGDRLIQVNPTVGDRVTLMKPGERFQIVTV